VPARGPALEKLRKAELAARAQDIVAGTGWLPEPLRIAASVDDDEAEVSEEHPLQQAAE